jgi:hypothetical protein
MIIGSSSPIRQDWYDRGMVFINNRYRGASVAPHAETSRWTYTVPTAKRAVITYFSLQVLRQTAATTLGNAYAYIGFSGAVVATVFDLGLYNNTVGEKSILSSHPFIVIPAATVVTGFTSDDSTGGAMNYIVILSLHEFDV